MTDNQERHRPGRRRGENRPTRGMLQHPDLDTLNAYLDGGLSPGERVAAAAHLAACPDCRREYAELRATVSLLRGLPQYAPRRSFQLGPVYARASGSGPIGGGWLARLLPALPALRTATVGVAVLLLVATAGDLVTNRTSLLAPPAPEVVAPVAGPMGRGAEERSREDATMSPPLLTPTRVVGAPTVVPTPRSVLMQEAPNVPKAPGAAGGEGTESATAPSSFADAASEEDRSAAGGAAAPAESGQLVNATAQGGRVAGGSLEEAESAPADAAPAESLGAAAESDDEPAAGEPRTERNMATSAGESQPAAAPAIVGVSPASPAAPEARDGADRRLAAPTAQVAARSVGEATPAPTATTAAAGSAGPAPGEPIRAAPVRVSGWRAAQVGLGALLLGLVVVLFGLQRLQRRG